MDTVKKKKKKIILCDFSVIITDEDIKPGLRDVSIQEFSILWRSHTNDAAFPQGFKV